VQCADRSRDADVLSGHKVEPVQARKARRAGLPYERISRLRVQSMNVEDRLFRR